MKLFITGTPGTGKSSLSLALKNEFKEIFIYEMKELLIKFDLLEEYEPERDTTIFDDKSAKNEIELFLKDKENYILAGPPIPFDNLDFTCIIVLTCSKKLVLEERLKTRNYKTSKIQENLESELLGEILGEVMDYFSANNKILVLDSCKNSIGELVNHVKRFIDK